MNTPDIKAARRICMRVYGRSVTAEQAVSEIANVTRKHAAGSMDDRAERLYAAFDVAGLIPETVTPITPRRPRAR